MHRVVDVGLLAIWGFHKRAWASVGLFLFDKHGTSKDYLVVRIFRVLIKHQIHWVISVSLLVLLSIVLQSMARVLRMAELY